ncbi:phage minor tail protein L, partial [Enterovibrio norvegicus]|uniref:phage minor tail protein L n=1 Tax=Enterovibrio norvegicus TaxID=188144 RepID=UPI00036D85A9
MRNITLDMLLLSAQLEQPALVELFDLNLNHLGGDYLRFHGGTNELGGPVIWKGEAYQPYPVQATGFELNGKGTSNRPKFTASNMMGLLTGLNDAFDDLAGGIVTRRQVYVTHLDAANFADGNP